MPIPFIGKRFTPQAFQDYLKTVQLSGSFKPKFVTLHHTGIPTLAQRPSGFSDQHLQNLLRFYGDPPSKGGKGWSGAPHLFIDDRDDGIIVFQRLDRKGVHAASFNSASWGIEMLGNYDIEDFHNGRGAKVRDLSMKAIALMNEKLGCKAECLKFHRDDPLTTKRCPGTTIVKADVISRVAALMHTPPPPEMVVTPGPVDWTVILPTGSSYLAVETHQGRPIAHIRHFLDTLIPGGVFKLKADRSEVAWSSNGGTERHIPVADLDDDGKAWAFVRDLVTAAGHPLTVNGKTLTIG